MSVNTGKLSRHKERAIAALIQHGTILAAARSCDIAESTLRRWKQEPAFAKAYANARRALVNDTVAMIQRASGSALAALLRIITDPKAASTARVQAAKTVLEFAIREGGAGSGVELPDTDTAEGIAKAIGVVTRAVASGELKPAEGHALSALLESQRRAIDTKDRAGQFDDPATGVEWERPDGSLCEDDLPKAA